MDRTGFESAWREAFGWAVQGNLKPGTNTRFNIGSVSKVLAALATIILQDRRPARLNAPVSAYLPDFTMLGPEYRKIILLQLLSRNSGLPGTNAMVTIVCLRQH
ncbi:serine hydrolase domain-containing protein [Bordetella sp. FB-8]|uniref:serine hydrolase n=1 Tax=Bordetella sp. FB-8 TaxID=1159870 RepID=UPI0009DA6D9A|nr:serine hydrolase domain-containing protein [Bordetella sp. FB-8]